MADDKLVPGTQLLKPEYAGTAIDPTSQFVPKSLVEVAGIDWLTFTSANLMMFLGVLATLVIVTTGLGRSAGRVPTRMQVVAEGAYGFVKTTLLSATGEAGKPYLRLMLTLFFFIAMGNFLGMVTLSLPGVGNPFFTYTSHFAITASLGFGLMIFVTSLGFYKHGLKFLTLFVPHGVPLPLLLILVPIEVISYLTRPITLAVRLFANMVAGHALLKTLASFPYFVASSTGALALGLVTTFAIQLILVPLTGLEFVIAFLQAYVFVMLGSMYFKDAIHLH